MNKLLVITLVVVLGGALMWLANSGQAAYDACVAAGKMSNESCRIYTR